MLTACSCSIQPLLVTYGDWKIRPEFEGPARTAATGFTIATRAFVGTAVNSSHLALNDFWLYDQPNNSWVQMANFPGLPRWGGVGFAIGDNGYIGLGIDGNGNRLKDIYEYKPD